jgi:hypothetical protein
MRIVPSDVAAFIKRLFPGVKAGAHQGFFIGHAAHFRAILSMLDRIPENLIALSAEEFSLLLAASESMRNQLDWWNTRGDQKFDSTPGWQGEDPVTLIFLLLSKCPDEAPGSQIEGLEFIADQQLRDTLRVDRANIDRAILNGEWKAATVLSGSLLEALFLWAITNKLKTEIDSAIAAAQKKGVLPAKINDDPQYWHLHELIEVSLELGMVDDSTAKQVRLAKDFRNLIHPGREQRLSMKCGRAEALGAGAAVEHVVRDLGRSTAKP